jgi:lipopolysaccharide export system permease protein
MRFKPYLLDRYIFGKLLTTYIFVVLILLSVLCVIEFTERNGDFIKNKAPGNEILDYFISYLPYWANQLSPLMIFISTVFVTSRMAAHTEVVAILSSGVSFVRFLAPFFVGSVVVAVIIYFLVGWVIPNTNITRIEFERKYVKQPYSFEGRNVHLRIAPDTYAYLESYSNTVKSGYRFTLETLQDTELKSKLSATRISWNEDQQNWRLDNCVVRTIEGTKETFAYLPFVDTTINLLPKDFENEYKLNEMLTNDALEAKISEMKLRGTDGIELYIIERYERDAYPFAILILTIIGVILSARKVRGGASIQIAFGFVLAFIYIFFVMVSKNIAMAGDLPPLLAVWLPNLIFGSIGLTLYKTIPQ